LHVVLVFFRPLFGLLFHPFTEQFRLFYRQTYACFLEKQIFFDFFHTGGSEDCGFFREFFLSQKNPPIPQRGDMAAIKTVAFPPLGDRGIFLALNKL